MSEIKLLTAPHEKPIVIKDLYAKIVRFVEDDAYVPYDYWITTRNSPQNTITWDHVYAINNAMRARSSRAAWQLLVDQVLPELQDVPADLDLIDGPQAHVDNALDALGRITKRISAVKGLTDMAASKVLFLMRPKLVVISDSYIRLCLGVRDSDFAGLEKSVRAVRRLRESHEAMRALGIANLAALTELHTRVLSELQTATPTAGSFKGQSVPVQLSKVRLLDILLWSHIAINGATPHIGWRDWHDGLKAIQSN